MAMSRKHYEHIAAAIKRQVELIRIQVADSDSAHIAEEIAEDLANDVANQFEADNPNFDRDRFLAACGFTTKRN